MTEEWRPIFGYEDIYEISREGRVRSLDREVGDQLHRHWVRGREMRTTKTRTGRLQVTLYSGNTHSKHDVDALVSATFTDQAEEQS